MKILLTMPIVVMISLPIFAQTRTYDSDVPILEDEYIEVEDVTPNYDENLEMESLEQQRMEELEAQRFEQESMDELSDNGIDYSDRTRTNRERRAINTSGDASDDR